MSSPSPDIATGQPEVVPAAETSTLFGTSVRIFGAAVAALVAYKLISSTHYTEEIMIQNDSYEIPSSSVQPKKKTAIKVAHTPHPNQQPPQQQSQQQHISQPPHPRSRIQNNTQTTTAPSASSSTSYTDLDLCLDPPPSQPRQNTNILKNQSSSLSNVVSSDQLDPLTQHLPDPLPNAASLSQQSSNSSYNNNTPLSGADTPLSSYTTPRKHRYSMSEPSSPTTISLMKDINATEIFTLILDQYPEQGFPDDLNSSLNSDSNGMNSMGTQLPQHQRVLKTSLIDALRAIPELSSLVDDKRDPIKRSVEKMSRDPLYVTKADYLAFCSKTAHSRKSLAFTPQDFTSALDTVD